MLTERVAVEQGVLVGSLDGDVLRYRGVPFAAPPVGPLRWSPPEPPAAWDGERSAAAPGPRCPQAGAAPGVAHATAPSLDEDCLRLDVTVPVGTTPVARKPVVVWLHGGGFAAGAGGDHDPRRLVTRGDLVVVTVNHRLGALGFLALPGLAGSGSFGLLDQQAALRWVARNIAAFGGDPDNVTVAGASAGAGGVCAHLVSPGSVGLFDRAVLQSAECGGTAIVDVIRPGFGPAGDTWKPLAVAEEIGGRAAAALGCTEPARLLSCLRGVPVEALLAVPGVYWSPAVGTPTLPDRPSAMIAAGDVRPVPVLAGTTRDEGSLFTTVFFDGAGEPVTRAALADLFAAAAGPRAGEAAAAYGAATRAPGRVWADVVTDRAHACPGLDLYRALSADRALHVYEFADASATSPYANLPDPVRGTVTHGADVPFLLDLVPGQPDLSPTQRATADAIVDRWAAFARDGVPGPGWPAFGPDGPVLTITADGERPVPAATFAAAHRCTLWTAPAGSDRPAPDQPGSR